MKRIEVTKERIEALLKTMTMEEVGRELGVSGQTIKRRVKEFGIVYNPQEKNSFAHILTKEYLESVKDTHTIDDVAKETGLGRRVIRKYIDNYGIKLVPIVLRGEDSPAWKGGSFISNRKENQYRYIYVDGKHYREHILVMEQHIGRKLNKGEVVHHVDGDGLNNNLDNLVLMTKDIHDTFHRLLGLLRIDHRGMTKAEVLRFIDAIATGEVRKVIQKTYAEHTMN